MTKNGPNLSSSLTPARHHRFREWIKSMVGLSVNKKSPSVWCPLLIAVFWCLAATDFAAAQAPIDEQVLPSWNDGPAKKAILAFVRQVTTEGSDDYLPLADRVAVFDNDGTLWPENPLPFQLMFVLDELRRLAPQHPEWQQNSSIQAALRGDAEAIQADLMPALQELLAATHAGLTTEEFDRRVRDWLATAKHPRFGRHYHQTVYQPMLELLDLLRAKGFRAFIVSGGGADFMRVWTEDVYGIPPHQTIGSIGPVHFELRRGLPVLIKDPGVAFVNDKQGKPVAIHRHIGRRPVACFGNSDGDQAMLQWTTVGNTPSFGLIVHHTDGEREYRYDKEAKISGTLIKALEEAPRRGWVVVDMAGDWNQLWPELPLQASANATLQGTSWRVEDIEGRGVIDRTQTTLQFAGDGSISGSTAVNRYSGKVTVDQRSIRFGPIATTRRAGPQTMMNQESSFLAALERTATFRLEDDQSSLVFLDSSGKELLRCSPLQKLNK